ncbi:glycosyltransferase [Labrys wisconsinensis]|uniref:Glycosyltransferase involved in cell wall biosynthesis n=1 Tax=Labrys wisconsinensis TaxID=425677 RepID=A0ABU0J599_9HYPH|nr:glycosyltransferase [Labrys wisconsinensis]MDQ0468736.1 glycosyltransferase involved in cell wall biosynthesis [Labrys wisconsinensis]
MPERLLVLLPADGHGGCEYNALSFARFAARTLGLAVATAFPSTATTQFLGELADANGLPWHDLRITFEADDDAERFAAQRACTAALIEAVRPDAVFLAMPWPARGGGVIAACADAGIPALVKFALVPEVLHGPPEPVAARLRQAIGQRQLWFANSRHSAALLERHLGLAPGAVDHFHVGPIGLRDLLDEAETGSAIAPAAARRLVRDTFSLPDEALVVTTVARLSMQKGYDTLLEAAALLRDDPRLRFLWVGEGELRPALEAGIAERGLAGRVVLAGFRRDVRQLLRGSDIFALPTVYEGGCSQALLEAMEEGLAIAVTRASAVAEVAQDEVEALLADVGDAEGLAARIRRLADDAPLRRRLGAAAARRARLFSREVMFKQTVLRLDRLLGTGHAAHPDLAAVDLESPAFSRADRPEPAARRAESGFAKILRIFARFR